ncbi:MAG: cytochrome-c peroxidase [Runella slithyformis]|nr:MAG: cytochrome-c peroxidase [Runella slithyformis]TAE91247.1 MAG: cytochrome-c peroxidase [Runella slithyformis]TAF29016.1 MAG: cytochrome-c peroxidase [Runella slithyformis]TAF46475.1 MAG: cytochrome-c peroxidase [Runella slithyformis]TAF82580.1 MAG: cytochrome-c peroxidase [Runella slithyformis]
MKKVFFTLLVLSVGCGKKIEDDQAIAPKPTDKQLFSVPAHFPKPEYALNKNKITQAGFELGRTLFYDGILSRDGTIACGECHRQEYAFTHHQHDVSHGIDNQLGERNAPAIQNMAWKKEFFWDGGVHDLDLVPVAAIESPIEMDEKLGNVLEKLKKTEKYPALFEKAYGSKEITSAKFLKALSQFMLALTSSNAKYDKYIRNEAGGTLTADETAGLNIFQQKCGTCHGGELFTDQTYRNNGLKLDVTRQVVVNGKLEIKRFDDKGRYRITQIDSDLYKFKVPSLRNIAVTRPYMHDGRFWTLEEVLNHYSENMIDNGYVDNTLKINGKAGLKLTDDEKRKIIVFLNTLTDRNLLLDPKFSEQR